MIWNFQGDRFGVISSIRESPDQPTLKVYEVWERETDGEPGEYLAEYRDLETAMNKVELLDRFRETMRECLAPLPEEGVII